MSSGQKGQHLFMPPTLTRRLEMDCNRPSGWSAGQHGTAELPPAGGQDLLTLDLRAEWPPRDHPSARSTTLLP
ncbi:unnamed protein product [Lota lota]